MDHKIYGRLQRTDLGVYGTRRFPKGQAMIPDVMPSGPTNPIDPSSNPLTIHLLYRISQLGTHTETERWAYTVPLGRRATIQSAYVQIARTAVLATGLRVSGGILILRKNDPVSEADIVRTTSHNNNSFDDTQRAYTGTPIELFSGDRIRALTINASAQNLSFELEAIAIEYNAEYRTLQGYAASDTFNPRK